jgi:hypothetical protein
MSSPASSRLGPRAIAIVGLAALAIIWLAVARPTVVNRGATMQLDDFFFKIGNVERSIQLPSSGDSGESAMVNFIVPLTIANRAKRVNFRFSDSSLVIVDMRSGRRYHVNGPRQKAREVASGNRLKETIVLKAGESATKEYVFSVPATISEPRLKVIAGGSIGEFLDRVLGQPTEFQLP